MTSIREGDGPSSPTSEHAGPEDGPFVLRSLLDEVPLSAEGTNDDIKINCVDYLDHNLYVGTSASELLHFVQIPPDPSEKSGQPVYILASRLCPLYAEPSAPPSTILPGVQQILLLPRAGKACILCNWTVTFYSLPELSPVFGTTQVKNCNWIGGVDLNEPAPDDGVVERSSGVTVLLSLNRRIQVVRIGDDARVYKKIDFSGSNLSVRRDSIACVADSKSYALLDVDRQLKIPLMSISSLDESQPPGQMGQAQSIATDNASGILRSSSSAHNRPSSNAPGHSRSTSLGGSILGTIRRHEQRGSEIEEPVFQDASPPGPSTSPKPPGEGSSSLNPPSLDKPLPAAPSRSGTLKPGAVLLKPHIASPTSEEFLLVTGTSPLEPGIGIFVNLDGDPTRPTLEFDRYPKEVVVTTIATDLASSRSGIQEEEEGYVLASMTKDFDDGLHHGLEIQRYDAGAEARPEKHWLEAKGVSASTVYGIRSLTGSEETHFEEIVEKLCQRKFAPFSTTPEHPGTPLKTSDSRTALSIEQVSKEKELFEQTFDSQDEGSLPDGWQASRISEGEELPRRLAKAEAKIVVWCESRIWWAIRNPVLVQLDAALDAACLKGYADSRNIDRRAIFTTLNSIRGRDARTELEFMTYGYIRQKAGVLLLINLLQCPEDGQFTEPEMKALEEILVDSSLDPRVVLSLIPGVRNEIIEGRSGIWIYGGVRKTAEPYLQSNDFETTARDSVGTLGPRTVQFLRRFLAAWRKKKGFGSVADEKEVFRTVDAALLLVLLEIDQRAPKGLGKGGAVRAELNDLVDKGVDCFERAVDLLEFYHRLFILSRLYQSRKMSGDVLATWKRIVEGERDDGQELQDGELRVREYLTKISSQALVQEYGIWLANRNPKLGVQVFAEDKGRARNARCGQILP
ncbi:hypothetical protein G7046_g6816 [Stylonectria norvegica]|nr:hypothetical protein G7046_g6816 [Stylonectria norvegica]